MKSSLDVLSIEYPLLLFNRNCGISIYGVFELSCSGGKKQHTKFVDTATQLGSVNMNH